MFPHEANEDQAPHPFAFYLSDSGGMGSGIKDMATAFPMVYYLMPPAGTKLWIHSVCLFMADAAGTFDTNFFGAQPALANGCLFRIQDRATPALLVDLLDGYTLQNNARILQSFGIRHAYTTGAVFDAFTWVWDFETQFGGPVLLDGDRQYSLEFETQDNLGLMQNLTMLAVGYRK